jgi:hypothetical protein
MLKLHFTHRLPSQTEVLLFLEVTIFHTTFLVRVATISGLERL